MAKVGLSTGSAANAGDGSTLRTGANIINANFDEIYEYFGDGSTLSFSGGNWIDVATGINTLSYVGIATTNPTDALTVRGAANISGVITASSFSGIGSFTDFTVSAGATFNGVTNVGAGITMYASSGIVSATQFFGDGSTLLSVPSGLGTALSDDTSSALNKIYYIDSTLGVGATVTVDPPASSQVAFTQFPNVEVLETFDLIVADGDDFIPDILGIGTTGIGGPLSGSGGRVRADNYTNKRGGAPTFPAGVVVSGIATVGDLSMTGFQASGIVTASGGFVGNLTGTASTATAAANAYSLTGSPDITVDLLTANDVTVGGAVTITGNLTVDGTQTIVNTSTLDIADKTVGIASTTNATDSTAAGAGIEIYASSATANNNKTLLWQNTSACFESSEPFKFKGVSETVSAATTYLDASSNVVLEMDLAASTIYTYTMPSVWSSGRGSNIGIVSFKNMPADSANATTITLITTQGAAHGGATGYANTVYTNGIGATCTIIGRASGTSIAGISTAGKSNGTGLSQPPIGITTAVLSPGKDAVDFISFFIHYNGSSNSDLNSYKVYVRKDGGYGFSGVGI
tara:strand:+ start:5630 stop:7354 length:1725 start_codon:yes stop_codon:yes gene_type:complete